MNFKKIIISRIDSIGDVVLTLPVAGILKKLLPECEIIFLGKSYTKDIGASCEFIDQFIEWDNILKLDQVSRIQLIQNLQADAIIHVFPVKAISKLAKQAKIPIRIGTTGRFYHYLTCNRLIALSRRRSKYHEAQLNLKLIQPFGSNGAITIKDIQENYGFANRHLLRTEIKQLVVKDKFNLVLHPKSKGSAREWGLANYSELIQILPENRFRIFITGTLEDGLLIKKDLIDFHPNIIDLTGKLSLKELISFINEADGMAAASTGPLHIAAALGKHALGLYPPIKPMHPGRWAPLGKRAEYLVLDKKCSKCRNKNNCDCLEGITPLNVKNKILSWLNG
jgi:heptosyltransferase-3